MPSLRTFLRGSLMAGLAVLLSGCQTSDEPLETCTDRRAYQVPFDQLTDAQLRVEIARACGRVLIGFKEANASRGVDDRGAVLTSAATISTMKQYLVDHDVQITWEGLSLPAVAATMDWSFTEVAALRRHPNIDYLEPVFSGNWAE